VSQFGRAAPVLLKSKLKPKAKAKEINNFSAQLRINQEFLIGKYITRFFKGYGGARGLVRAYHLKEDAYEIAYSDGHVDMIQFDDILKLIPNSSLRIKPDHKELWCLSVCSIHFAPLLVVFPQCAYRIKPKKNQRKKSKTTVSFPKRPNPARRLVAPPSPCRINTKSKHQPVI